MGDILGPYGRDHQCVLDWAWQTWPGDRHVCHRAGSTDQTVALIRRHVQCEIDLHYSSCMLLSTTGVLPPLVFRPWCVDIMQQWDVVGRDSMTSMLTECPRVMFRLFGDLLTWDRFEQINV